MVAGRAAGWAAGRVAVDVFVAKRSRTIPPPAGRAAGMVAGRAAGMVAGRAVGWAVGRAAADVVAVGCVARIYAETRRTIGAPYGTIPPCEMS